MCNSKDLRDRNLCTGDKKINQKKYWLLPSIQD